MPMTAGWTGPFALGRLLMLAAVLFPVAAEGRVAPAELVELLLRLP
jgi:hypothetical protein